MQYHIQRNYRQISSMSAMSNVHFYLYTLQSEMERIIKMQREYMNDEDLQLLSVASWDMTPYERTSRALKLQKKLDLMRNSSIYIQNVSAHIPMMERTISTSQLVSEIPLDEFKALQATFSRTSFPLVYWENRLFLSVPYPNPPLPYRDQPMFLLAAELSTHEIKKMLNQFFHEGQGGAFLLNKNWTLANGI